METWVYAVRVSDPCSDVGIDKSSLTCKINHEITKNVLVYDEIAYIKSHNEEKLGEYLMKIARCNAN